MRLQLLNNCTPPGDEPAMKARARGIQNAQLICSTLLSRLWGGTRATWEPREHSTSSCGLQSSSPELGSCSPNLHPTYAKDTTIYPPRPSRGGGGGRLSR